MDSSSLNPEAGGFHSRRPIGDRDRTADSGPVPPIEPRERDYTFTGATFAFAIWIGLGVLGIADPARIGPEHLLRLRGNG